MPFYLVSARIKTNKIDKLERELAHGNISRTYVFGPKLSQSLLKARLKPNNTAIWEEEDSGIPPLMREREMLLDEYFDDIRFTEIQEGSGWDRISRLPRLFYSLTLAEARSRH